MEQTAADVPCGNDWLGVGEAARLDGFRFAKRRADWRMGRWTAKRAIASVLGLPADSAGLARIEIVAAASGAPEAIVDHEPAPVAISISHCAGSALCAVAPVGTAVGCDLESIEARSAAFLTDVTLTAAEQSLAARTSPGDLPLLLALLWSGKESALKALKEGLRLDTRSVEVTVAPSALQVRFVDGRIFHGWWARSGTLVRTVVAIPAPRMYQL